MEVITTFVMISIFFLFYLLGRKEGNYVLEMLGGFGILLIGIFVWTTHLNMAHIMQVSSTVDQVTYVETLTNSIVYADIPASYAYGVIIFVIGLFMMLETIFSMRGMMKNATRP
jgi:hypothetical protein